MEANYRNMVWFCIYLYTVAW